MAVSGEGGGGGGGGGDEDEDPKEAGVAVVGAVAGRRLVLTKEDCSDEDDKGAIDEATPPLASASTLPPETPGCVGIGRADVCLTGGC